MNEEKVKIIELERRDPQSEAKYWNQKYTETLLELFKEKEKNKKLEEEWDEAIINAYFNKEDVCNKVVDMLIEDIIEYHIPADFCMQYGKYKENCKTLDDNQMCKKCIRDYYFKKARGESNE